MKLGHKLAELRGKLKFSQQEVSDKLNIKQYAEIIKRVFII